MNDDLREMYRVFHPLVDLGWDDLDFECSTVCPILPGLKGIWQKRLGSWARWWNTEIKVNPTQVYEHMGRLVLISALILRSRSPYSVGLIHEVLRGVEVERELVETCVLDVVPGLEVRDVEGVADAGDVRPEEGVRRAEQRQDPVLHLTAHL